MSALEIPLSALAGRKVRTHDGRYVGRLTEVEGRIDLRDGRSDYVVDRWHVSHFGALDWLAGSRLTQQLIERLGSAVGYACHRYPASALDLSDPHHPRLR